MFAWIVQSILYKGSNYVYCVCSTLRWITWELNAGPNNNAEIEINTYMVSAHFPFDLFSP